MITVDELRDLNPTLSDNGLQQLADELNEKIDKLVGEEVVESLTPDDVDTLADMQDTASEQELADWVAEHVPDYPEIMQNNKDIVLGDYADSINETAGENSNNE